MYTCTHILLVCTQDPPPFFPPIPPEERRPIRVLGLFDGIATGLLVLKELGVEVERYVASEVDQDAMYVSKVQHNEIIHIGCIERITEKEVCVWSGAYAYAPGMVHIMYMYYISIFG